MNDKELQLLEKLASKLGTTTEYLWGVLLKQAQVDAIITLTQVVIVMLIGVLLYKMHKHFSNTRNKINYQDNDAHLSIVMFLAACGWGILVLISLFCIDDIFNGFFNPEFWALNYVLNHI